MPRMREKYGSRKALVRRLWSAIRKTAKLLEHEDPQVALRAAHALATLTPAYRAAYQEMEEEDPAIKRRREEAQRKSKELVALEGQAIAWMVSNMLFGLERPIPEDPRVRALLVQWGHLTPEEAFPEGEAKALPALEGGEDGP
jgi:hypothetical protein